ncbi:tetraacyldisaccharide 4'-kinase [Gilvimarinus sp. SDUM040013]|uniref:Tetraacyldisaccharide 4'-kinase n=1 Tax=Gilvimarinus gilvus TaxID=3058038 RepID=A0ABU4S324_9GAMM|nr:tetraacyldisaccharide 4'-kinase [Gilvimarinus sp. SDUM040013]MDO3387149.1 tetraacyldisaccharide 4'-kinase [Gilvimarinus sp. SDUM040013]MDX6850892.1 tetraacyldisaccharide 4'-kinase [Gilvimarinus sp. SDUM040013]
MSNDQEARWLDAWYGGKRWVFWLLPLEGLFRVISFVRRAFIRRFRQKKLPVPVIVVGNLSVGGTGKTPVIIALVNHLQTRGFKVGVVSRGYGSRAPEYPYVVTAASSAEQAGDEPLSIWRATGCAVCIDANRVAAARTLVQSGCTVLLSDDGLQHYRLGRDIEIAVLDAARGMGNGHCLPVGPLREAQARLQEVDFVVANQTQLDGEVAVAPGAYHMRLQPRHWFRVKNLERLALDAVPSGSRVHAVAGIGNPQRFFDTLARLNLAPQPHIYPDHHAFTAANFSFNTRLPVVMTSKDAVKCQSFAKPDWLALEVEAVIDKKFWPALDAALSALSGSQQVTAKGSNL